ncbi:hypothetical protein QQ045_016605 [Rhodiola kirilowii]
MACRTSMRSLFLSTEPWCPAHRSFISASRNPLMTTSSLPKPKAQFRISRASNFYLYRPIHRISSSDYDSASVSGDEQGPPQEAILKAIAVRGFTAIGTGGDDFVQSMVVAVESVIQQPIPEGRITQKVSSRGKYVSVNIGPVRVVSSEQVQAVYNAMRRDDRMKYFL